MSSFRIPLMLDQGGVAVLDDLDLAYFLRHSGASLPVRLEHLAARDAKGRALPVQWLRRGELSLVAGQRCGTLLVDAAASKTVDVFVQAGPQELPAVAQKEPHGNAVTIQDQKGSLHVTVDGKPFVTYRYNTKDPELPRPYFHPLLGPAGQVITQLGEVPGKRVAHFHHTALWIAHQNFAAQGDKPCDNWQIGRPNSSKIEHVRFDSIQNGPMAGRFVERLHWLNVKGDRVLLEETRTVTIPRRAAASRVLDVEIQLRARAAAVTLLRTPYHLLAVRVVNAMLPAGGGVITNSAGAQNPADGAPADWIDISGPLDKAWQGVALFNHPGNIRQPTPCLQFSRQTIGLSPSHREPLAIEAKQDLRLRYRVLVHAGNVKEGRVDAEYQAYRKPPQARIGPAERVPAT